MYTYHVEGISTKLQIVINIQAIKTPPIAPNSKEDEAPRRDNPYQC